VANEVKKLLEKLEL